MTATTIEDDRLSETFAALANTTRRSILARLAEGEASVNELAAPFDLTLPAISKHLKVLERAGLVVRGRRAQYRPCTLDASPLRAVSSWAEQYRPVWERRLDRMSEHLERLQATSGPPPGPSTDHGPGTDSADTDTRTDTDNQEHRP